LLLLWAGTVIAAALVGTHGIAYWDAGDYVLLAVNGGKSGLLLGRPLFVWMSQLIVAAGVEPENAEVVLRWFWAGVGATAAPLMAVLAAQLGLARGAALTAGAVLAMSPSFAHTAHQVLTDAPALALSIAALSFAASGRAALAGVLLAAAIATRETAAVHGIAILLLLGRPLAWRFIVACAGALAMTIAVSQPPAVFTWFGTMALSAGGHPWGIADLLTSLLWVFAAGPIVVIVGIAALGKGAVNSRVKAVAWPAAIATAVLLFYPDGSFSPRYVLATAPLAFFIAAAPWLASRPALTMTALVVPLAIATVAARPASVVAKQGATLTFRIPQLPARAVVVPGHFCPQARLAAAFAKRDDLEFVCPGWSWPADLGARLDAALREGQPVAVDVGDSAWVGRREIQPREAARAWTSARGDAIGVAGFAVVNR
jgi:hypothetical protein